MDCAALDCAADGYVNKPFAINELIACIRETLRRSDSPGEARPPGASNLRWNQPEELREECHERSVQPRGTKEAAILTAEGERQSAILRAEGLTEALQKILGRGLDANSM